MVSIIIRTKNEEKWIASCLSSVFEQSYKDFEVIIVDNNSTDRTVEKARVFDVDIVHMGGDFLPGKAINMGILRGKGDLIVCLSGHCIPVNDRWLENLIRNFQDKDAAGVYGRQEAMSFTSDFNKRDLIMVFGLDRKVQKKDPFFHNANSAIRRKIWEEIPFDENVTNIEDRVWGKEVLAKGYTIIYEPEARVYHHHGIHQDGDSERCRNIVSILESLEIEKEKNNKAFLDINKLNVTALIPVKGEIQYCGKRTLLEYTVDQALDSRFIDKAIVLTDNPDLAQLAQRSGAEAPFIRPKELSMEFIDTSAVLQYSLGKLEEINILPDIVVVMRVTYPFRSRGFIDQLIIKLIREGLDSVVPVKPEYRVTWLKEGGETRMLGQGFMPRQFKNSPLYISLLGLGYVTLPSSIREGNVLGNNVGMLEVTNPYSHIEVRDQESIDFASKIIDYWKKRE
jgi:glycosyltransferase involved in cell wall biosynthesis